MALIWLIRNRLAKASHNDVCQQPAVWIYVAEDMPFAHARLSDSPVLNDRQRSEFKKAVDLVLECLNSDKTVIVACVSGVSRSVTVACVAAALYKGTSFMWQFARVLSQDYNIFNPSPVRTVAADLYPQLFV